MTYREELDAFRSQYPFQELRAGGAVFRYILAGPKDARTLVFLNGGTNTCEMWMRYVQPFADRWQVLLFDYPRELATNPELVQGMHAFFEALHLEKPVLIGASYGGMAAQMFTQQYPDFPGGLVLLSTGGMDKATLRSLHRKYFLTPVLLWYMKRANYEKMKPKLIDLGASHAKNESPENQRYAREMFETIFADYTKEKDLHITGLLGGMMHMPPVTADTFAPLAGKILLILPTQDFFSPKMQQDLIALMHGPKLMTIAGGHIATILQPEVYIRAIGDFLQQID